MLTFRELASFHELLHAQVDLILVSGPRDLEGKQAPSAESGPHKSTWGRQRCVGTRMELDLSCPPAGLSGPLPQGSRLQGNWSRLAGEAKDCKKRAEKRASEYDAARLKHLGHK